MIVNAPGCNLGCSSPRLVALFAVMYYAGLRPEEAINLGRDNIILPLYAKCVAGQDELAKRRISEALLQD